MNDKKFRMEGEMFEELDQRLEGIGFEMSHNTIKVDSGLSLD